MRPLIGLLTLLVLCLSSLLVWSQQHYEHELVRLQGQVNAVTDAVQRQTARAASETAMEQSLLDEVNRLRAEELRVHAALAHAAPAPSQDSHPTEKSPGATPPQPSISSQELFQHIEESFLLDGLDSTWSRDTERELRDKLATHLAQGASLRSMECHASLCRLEVQHPGEPQALEFMNPLTQVEPRWKGAMMTYRTESNGSGPVTVSYLAREGHELPFPTDPGSSKATGH